MSDFWTGVVVTVVLGGIAYWVYGCVQDGLSEYRTWYRRHGGER